MGQPVSNTLDGKDDGDGRSRIWNCNEKPRFNGKRLFTVVCHTTCVDFKFSFQILLAACVIGHLLGAFEAPKKSREI